MKKILSILMLLALCLSMAPSFAGAEEMVTINYVVPGTAPSDYDMVIAAVNEKLAKDCGIQVKVTYYPWDVWDSKLNLMLSTGEEFDLFHVMQDRVSFATYYSRGGLADITDALAKNGEHILSAIDSSVMSAAQIGGHTYCIPTNWAELGVEGVFTVRNDILAKYNKSVPTTPAEMLDTLEAIMGEWDGDDTPYLNFIPSYDPSSNHLNVLHSEYDSYPFNVVDGLFMVAQDGAVTSWVESDEFKQDAAFMNEAYTRGLIDPDVLTTTNESHDDMLKRGQFVFHFGTLDFYADMVQTWPELQLTDVTFERFNADRGSIRPWAFKNCNAVSSTSKHVDEAVQFIDWLYTDQANFDLFFYGIEGTHYTVPEEGRIEQLVTSDVWAFSTWMAGNMNFQRYPTTTFPSLIEALYTKDDTAVNSVAGGFFFDASPVQAEYSNLQTEMEACITPIYMGVQSYDEAFDAALQRLKDAGLDTVLAEYQRQFSEYMASMN
ncbi:MAG: extracellular solute-binding protein [Eubacteriales bacterium]|nr:extracellular solute-binding protein [Eubacteriales bacterium]